MSRRIADSRVRAYIVKLPPKTRSHMRKIRDAIFSVATDGVDVISYRIPAVKWNGRMLVYYAAWRTHCSLYPPTVRLPLDKPVPVTRIKRLVKARMAKVAVLLLALSTFAAPARAQKRLVLIDQDAAGPAGSDQMSMLALLQSKQVEVLGITIVTGDVWRDEGVQHTLRMLELTGHGDVPVAPGAVFPLVRTQEETRLGAHANGKVVYLGAWNEGGHGPSQVPAMPEGPPKTMPLAEDAAHFLIRQVHAHPGQVTIYAAGPLTNIALAIAIDPTFAESTKGIVMMGSSLNPQTDDPEFATSPRFEFNFWFDPEATRKVLRAHWPRIDVTTVDVSIKAKLTAQMFDAIARSSSPAAQYIAKYETERGYMWDEIAACAWLDPSVITKTRDLYMDVDVGPGPGYGYTLTWDEKLKPAVDVQLVHAQIDLNVAKFSKMFVDLMSAR